MVRFYLANIFRREIRVSYFVYYYDSTVVKSLNSGYKSTNINKSTKF